MRRHDKAVTARVLGDLKWSHRERNDEKEKVWNIVGEDEGWLHSGNITGDTHQQPFTLTTLALTGLFTLELNLAGS